MDEADYLPIAILEKFQFCPRQAYLVHVERVFVENRFTIEGQLGHQRVHEADDEWRGETQLARGLKLVSHRLGVYGVADVVELSPGGVSPVEYKRGRRTKRACEHAQMCLQALCLEEMLNLQIPLGYVYHQESRRREAITIDARLRASVEALVSEARNALANPRAPAAIEKPHCRSCSLAAVCQPHVTCTGFSARRYLDEGLL
ncbi:MAG: CRISPR-associated protein Cas4 [Deltaproteobacteria bacterium]|nr:CRISPR-associated protein Cas4 [Deltaproteobacteria bacterium]